MLVIRRILTAILTKSNVFALDLIVINVISFKHSYYKCKATWKLLQKIKIDYCAVLLDVSKAFVLYRVCTHRWNSYRYHEIIRYLIIINYNTGNHFQVKVSKKMSSVFHGVLHGPPTPLSDCDIFYTEKNNRTVRIISTRVSDTTWVWQYFSNGFCRRQCHCS